MKRQVKQQNVTSIKFTFDGGMNYAQSTQEIADNEMSRATNWMYNPNTDIIEVRPGTTCVDTGFQTIYDGLSTTTGWLTSSAILTATSGGYSGTCFEVGRTDGTAPLSFAYTTFTELVTDGRYIVSFYVKSGTMGNYIYDVTLNSGGVGARHTFSGVPSTVWTQVTSSFTATGDENNLYLCSTPANTTGTLLFDEFLISRIDLPNAIRALHYYEKSSSEAWLCAASGSTLYSLSSTSSWNTIGTLSNSTVIPSMLTFNKKLLIADGNDNIRTWDGTTYDTILTSPQASALATIGNRVVANADDELDSVYLSGPEDETCWDTATTAIGLKAGYGDLLAVNGFGVYGTDLIVSKEGNFEKRLYRIDTSDTTPANWKCNVLSSNNCAQNAQSIVNAYNNVFFCDTDGFKSVIGVEYYGDLAVDPVGAKINALIANLTCRDAKYIPYYNCIFVTTGPRIFVYTERDRKGRFTDLLFKQGDIYSICQAGNTVYLGGENGYLYKLDNTVSTDETSPSVTESYVSTLRSKLFTFFTDVILRKMQAFITPIAAGAGVMSIITPNQTDVSLKTLTLQAEGEYLYDATTYLAADTGYLYDDTNVSYSEMTRNRARVQGMSLQIQTSSGRCGIDRVQAEIALLEGGE